MQVCYNCGGSGAIRPGQGVAQTPNTGATRACPTCRGTGIQTGNGA